MVGTIGLNNCLRWVGADRNLTTDAQLATLAIAHDAELASYDNDFARLERSRRENPLRARWSRRIDANSHRVKLAGLPGFQERNSGAGLLR